jgi:hypothetical protein
MIDELQRIWKKAVMTYSESYPYAFREFKGKGKVVLVLKLLNTTP